MKESELRWGLLGISLQPAEVPVDHCVRTNRGWCKSLRWKEAEAKCLSRNKSCHPEGLTEPQVGEHVVTAASGTDPAGGSGIIILMATAVCQATGAVEFWEAHSALDMTRNKKG